MRGLLLSGLAFGMVDDVFELDCRIGSPVFYNLAFLTFGISVWDGMMLTGFGWDLGLGLLLIVGLSIWISVGLFWASLGWVCGTVFGFYDFSWLYVCIFTVWIF